MSELQNIGAQVSAVAADITGHAQALHGVGQRLRRAASQAAAAARGAEDGGRGATSAASALYNAAEHCERAAQLLLSGKQAAESFVARHVGGVGGPGSPGGGASGFGSNNGRGGVSALASHWASRPGFYSPPTENDWVGVPEHVEPNSDPQKIAQWVNDGGTGVRGRDHNCADCARATELSWRGRPQVSASTQGGESLEDIGHWLGGDMNRSTFQDIQRELSLLGHGSSAYVTVFYRGGGGHAFNAVNHLGQVYFVDSQPTGGSVGPWPPTPSTHPYRFGEADLSETFATIFDADGARL